MAAIFRVNRLLFHIYWGGSFTDWIKVRVPGISPAADCPPPPGSNQSTFHQRTPPPRVLQQESLHPMGWDIHEEETSSLGVCLWPDCSWGAKPMLLLIRLILPLHTVISTLAFTSVHPLSV